MPKLITDYIAIESNDPDKQVKVETRITPDPKGLFNRPELHPKFKSWCFEIIVSWCWEEEEEEEEESDKEWYSERPLKFYYYGLKEPSLQTFSDHIYHECRAAVLAINPKRYFSNLSINRGDIASEYVYEYLKHLNLVGRNTLTKFYQTPNYLETVYFVKDYNYWKDRLYQTLKWCDYMVGKEWVFEFPFEFELWEFLELSPINLRDELENQKNKQKKINERIKEQYGKRPSVT